MQPLKATVSPSSLSTMGWLAWVLRSMMLSRRCPSAMRPCWNRPAAVRAARLHGLIDGGERAQVDGTVVEADLTAKSTHQNGPTTRSTADCLSIPFRRRHPHF
jgi:hypothetical protein